MNSLIFASTRNRFWRHDGDEFKREARTCCRTWREGGGTCTMMEYSAKGAANKRASILHALRCYAGPQPLDTLAFFCHGTAYKLDNAFGKNHVDEIAATVAKYADYQLDVVLYACLCGRERTGFGVALAAAFEKQNIDATVWAHITAGHTTRNPNVVICRSGGWLHPIVPTAKRREFGRWLKKSTNRFQFPFLQPEELAASMTAQQKK